MSQFFGIYRFLSNLFDINRLLSDMICLIVLLPQLKTQLSLDQYVNRGITNSQ